MKRLFERNTKDYEISRNVKNDSMEKYKLHIHKKTENIVDIELKSSPSDSKNPLQGCSLFNTTEEKPEPDSTNPDLSVSSDYRQAICQSKSQPLHEIFKNFQENWGFSDFGKFSQQIQSKGNEWNLDNFSSGHQSFNDKEFSDLGKSESLPKSLESNSKTNLTLTDVDMSPKFESRLEESRCKASIQSIDHNISSISGFVSNDRSKFYAGDDSLDQIVFSLEHPALVESASLHPQNPSISPKLPRTSTLLPSMNDTQSSSYSLYSPDSSFSSMQSSFSTSSINKQASLSNSLVAASNPAFSFALSNNTVKNSEDLKSRKKQESLTLDWSKVSGFSQSINEDLNLSTSDSDFNEPNQMTDIKSQLLPARKKFKPVEYWKNEEFLNDLNENPLSVNRKVAECEKSEPRKVGRKKCEKRENSGFGAVSGLDEWFFPRDLSKMEDFGEWKQGLIMENEKVRARRVFVKAGYEFCECSGVDCLVRMAECQKDSVVFELQGMRNYFNKEDSAYVIKGHKFTVVNTSQKTVKLLVFQFY